MKKLLIFACCVAMVQPASAMQKHVFSKAFKTYLSTSAKKRMYGLKQITILNKMPKLSFGTTYLMSWKRMAAAGALATGYGLWQCNEPIASADDTIVLPQEDLGIKNEDSNIQNTALAKVAYELCKQGVMKQDEAVAFQDDPLTYIDNNYKTIAYIKNLCEKRPDLFQVLGSDIALRIENDPLLKLERVRGLSLEEEGEQFKRRWALLFKIYYCVELFHAHPQFREVVCKHVGKYLSNALLKALPKSNKIRKEWITTLFKYAYLWQDKRDLNFIVQAMMPYVVLEELSQEQKLLFNDIISHSIESMPPGLLTKLEEQDKQLQTKVLSFYFAYGKHKKASTNALHETIAGWESVLKHYTLEELYTIKGYSRYGELSVCDGLANLDTYHKSQLLFEEIDTKKSQLVAYDDALSKKCRNIAFKYGLKIPTWIPFYARNKNFADGPSIYVGMQEGRFVQCSDVLQEDEFAFILGHELGHIMLRHSYAEEEGDKLANHNDELAADRFSCFRSKRACLAGIKWLSNLLKVERREIIEDNRDSSLVLFGEAYDHPRLNKFIEQQLAVFGECKTHPADQKRINKAKKIVSEQAKEAAGLCKNPFYKQLGSQKWFACK